MVDEGAELGESSKDSLGEEVKSNGKAQAEKDKDAGKEGKRRASSATKTGDHPRLVHTCAEAGMRPMQHAHTGPKQVEQKRKQVHKEVQKGLDSNFE